MGIKVGRSFHAVCWLASAVAGCSDGEHEAKSTSATGAGGTSGAGGSSLTTSTGGSAMGGDAGAAGASGGFGGGSSGGAAGSTSGDSVSGGSAGAAGDNSGACYFEVDAAVSSAIPTVGIVKWQVALQDLDEAHIDFGLAESGFSMVAPVDLDVRDRRTLLLGMKGEREYSFRIVATAGSETCKSETFTLTTGPVSNGLPIIEREVMNPDAVAPGFILTATGLGVRGGGRGSMAFIMDSDGDLVWWTPAPGGTGSARMSWEGTDMWMSAVNNGGGGGEVRRVSMDGLDVEAHVAGLDDAHHDFAVLPGGRIATIMHREGGCSKIVQRDPDGTLTDVIEDVSTLYEPVADCHPNAIHYYPEDDSFTLSDRNPSLFVKFKRSGELQWQFGGVDPKGLWLPGEWLVNHGHHLLENGHFVFFNNGRGVASSPVLEFALDPAAGTATQVWSYVSDNGSGTLGDVQRLPNGNTFITYSNPGVMHEVDPEGNLVQTISAGTLGYSTHRPTLYGPPPR